MPDFPGQNVMDFSNATRTSHPETSRQAEERITKTGKRQKHCQIILNCLQLHNGSTTKELAKYLSGTLTYAQIWRRRADLIHNEYIKIDGVRDGCGICWIK